MADFQYIAVDQAGKRLSKTMIANSRDEVAKFLTEKHYFIVSINDISDKVMKQGNRLTMNDKIFFTQSVSVLLQAGISLGESLAIIAADTPRKTTSLFYESIRLELEAGSPFSAALARYPKIFDPIYISLIKAGEASGELSTIMDSLSKSLDSDQRIRNQVRSALLYPSFIMLSLAGLVTVIVFFVLPRLTKVFTDLNVPLPFATRMLVALGTVAANKPFLLLGIIISVVATAVVLIRLPSTRRLLLRIAFYTPFIRQVIESSDFLHISSTLSLLIAAGVPIQDAIFISAGTVQHPLLNRELTSVSQKLSNGKTLTQALRETSLPRTFVALVSAGEQSGRIDEIFKDLAGHYQDVLDVSIKNFTGIIEPVLTLAVGLIVGGTVISILLPIYQFVGNLSNTIK